MSKYLNDPVNTFCIGFNDPKYDESPYAGEAATRFKTNHTLKKVDPNMIDLWQKSHISFRSTSWRHIIFANI